MAKPISPSEVVKLKAELMPDGVIEVFNELIAKAWTGAQAIVKQEEAVLAIMAKLGVSRNEVFKRRLLGVEDIFRKAGWRVEFDKPGFNESYEAYFVFVVDK